MVQRVTADRLILVDVVNRWFHLRAPTFIDAGQTYWIDHGTNELCVDRGGGRMTRHAGWMCR
jgi:hypothetical protein